MWTAIWVAWGVLSVAALAAPEAKALPVVPNFQQGTLRSTTTTRQRTNEVINSYQYRTGYEYSVSGTNVRPSAPISPSRLVTTTNSVNGITSVWRGLDPNSRPTWNIVEQGASFQFVEALNGPGLTEHTVISRETDIESVTETLSTFTQ
jgi:hypothetical protein